MKFRCIVIFILSIYAPTICIGQQYDEEWYENPLGWSPVELHTKNGFLIPGAIAIAGILLTSRDSTILNRHLIYSNSDYMFGYKYPYTFLNSSNTGFMFNVRKWLGLGFEGDIYLMRNSLYKSYGLAIIPLFRFNFINTKNTLLYFESGGGLVAFAKEFPRSNNFDNRMGTILNGTTKYGIGATVRIWQQVSVSFGMRHVHVSNGNVRGVSRNPSWDGNGFFAGVSIAY